MASPPAPAAAAPSLDTTSASAELSTLLTALSKDVATLSTTLTHLSTDFTTTPAAYTYPDGISLLGLKNSVLLDYLHHLVLLAAWRLSGNSLADPHSSGHKLVRNLIQLRLVLEKVKPLEGRLRYQIEKLLRAADDEDSEIASGRRNAQRSQKDQQDDEEEEPSSSRVDLLAFRPNPGAFMSDKARPDRSEATSSRSRERKKKTGRASPSSSESDDDPSGGGGGKTAVYRPPKVAPVAYDPDSTSSKRNRNTPSSSARGTARNSALLADLTAGLSSNPYELSSTGVGVGGRVASQQSARARALQRMQDYEEDNLTRLVMSKRDARKRDRDEADVALGGAGLSSGRDGRKRVGGGIEEEFGDLLRTGGYAGSGRKGNKARHSEGAFEALRGGSKRPRTVERAARRSGAGEAEVGTGSKTFRNKVKNVGRKGR